MITDDQLRALWEEIKRRTKAAGEINRPLWRALDAAVPIALDGRVVVVGLPAEEFHEAGAFENSENKVLLDKVLGSVASKPLELLVIEGSTKTEYGQWQAREAAAAELRRRSTTSTEAAEEDTSEEADEARASSVSRLVLQFGRELHVAYRALPNRSQTTARARFLVDALEKLQEVETQMAEMEGSPALKERQLSRAVDRLADMLDADAIAIAMEYERMKRLGR
ncbi:MAG: hypothetical protein HUU35_07630 [Armatimonadetes bacterium]|nr:hypothetical protein [Armatimonadota bacterium]